MDEATALAEISRLITSSTKLEEVFDLMAESISALVPADTLSISTVDLESGTYSTLIRWGRELPGYSLGTARSLAGTAAEKALTNGTPIVITDELVLEQARNDANPIDYPLVDLKSWLVAPLIVGGSAIGVMHLRARKKNAYTKRHLGIAERVANQIAGTIVIADLNTNLRREAEEKEKLAEIGRLLATPNLDRVYGQVARLIAELIPHDRIVLSSFDLDRELGTDRYVGGMEVRPGESGRTYPIPSSTAMGVLPRLDFIEPKILSGEAHREYARQLPDWQEKLDAGLLSVMGCSLVWEGQPVGFISLRSRDADAFG